MINSKNWIAILIPYFLLCCCLYHLTYWGSFDINGLSLISISNLIKSAIQPVIASFVGTFLGLLIAYLIGSKKLKIAMSDEEDLQRKIKGWLALLVPAMLCLFIFLIIKFNPAFKWLLISFVLGSMAYAYINGDMLFAKSFKPVLNKELLLMFMIYFPIFSTATGLEEAEDISCNYNYQYMIARNSTTHTASDTLKYLGKADDYFIFVTVDNEKQVYIKADTIVLERK
jgi:hypothetical protein